MPLFSLLRTSDSYKTDLLGAYQKKNAITAAAVFQYLKGFTVSAEHIKNGLLQVVKNTSLKGRWQILQDRPLAICDTAHNKEGLSSGAKSIKKAKLSKASYCFRSGCRKSFGRHSYRCFRKKRTTIFASQQSQEGLSEEVLEEKAREFQLIGKKYASVEKAYASALLNANQEDIDFCWREYLCCGRNNLNKNFFFVWYT